VDCEGRLLKPERQTGCSGTKSLHFTSSREPNLSHLQLPVVANNRACDTRLECKMELHRSIEDCARSRCAGMGQRIRECSRLVDLRGSRIQIG
jgi:hypothetical protein